VHVVVLLANTVGSAPKLCPIRQNSKFSLGLKSLIGEKDRRISDLEADRAQLREDRHRLTENWQEERVRLLKLIEDQTCTVKLLTDERSKLAAEIQRTFWQRLFRRKPAVAAA
jgi:endo-beta-N-acetylglucosaminidase D